MNKLFLLDAYALIYRAYYAFIKAPRINSKGLNTSAIFGFINTLEEVLNKEKPTHIGVAFDPAGPTFRHEAYEAYKAQREETPEGIRTAVPYIKRILEAYNIPILEVSGFEADDVIGTLATQAGNIDGLETFMMTPDKDYGQLVGEHVRMFRPKFGDKEFEILGPKEVCEKYGIDSPTQVIDLLGLMGDASDNIPGCPGVGEKTAVKLINQFGSIENLLEHTDELKGAMKTKVEGNIENIKFSKFLATIKIDVPITLDLENLKREKINEDKLREIFEELEFRNLLKRILGETIPKQQIGLFDTKPATGMLDMFAENPTETKDIFETSNLTDLKSTPHKYYIVDSESEMESLAEKFLTFDFVCLDTETTNIDAMSAELVGLSFSVAENEAYYIPIPAEKSEALKIVNKFKKVYEAENILKSGKT
jgi:DNA polymerase-1